jgi:hypothetical protein
MSLPIRRTLSLTYYEPWLLGWCRWEISSDLHYDSGIVVKSRLASGRWKWRGRGAHLVEAEMDASIYFKGLSR